MATVTMAVSGGTPVAGDVVTISILDLPDNRPWIERVWHRLRRDVPGNAASYTIMRAEGHESIADGMADALNHLFHRRRIRWLANAEGVAVRITSA